MAARDELAQNRSNIDSKHLCGACGGWFDYPADGLSSVRVQFGMHACVHVHCATLTCCFSVLDSSRAANAALVADLLAEKNKSSIMPPQCTRLALVCMQYVMGTGCSPRSRNEQPPVSGAVGRFLEIGCNAHTRKHTVALPA